MVLAAVVIIQRLVGRRAAMDRLEQVGAVLVAIAAGEAVGATVAMLVGLAGDLVETSELGVSWRSWWLADLAGGLVVVPLALAWAHTSASAWRGRRVVEAALMLAAVIGLSLLVFRPTSRSPTSCSQPSSGPRCASAPRARPWRSRSRR